jgi:hypothetical protein
MVFKAALLGNLLSWYHAAGPQSQDASENGKPIEAAHTDTKFSGDQPPTQTNREDDLVQPGGDDNEKDGEDVDFDFDDVDESLPSLRVRLFGRQLSISRTFTTFSTKLGGKPAETPAWLNGIKEFLRPTRSELPSNYRYTPLFSGIVIPFSILLEIPGLTDPWFIRTEGNETVEVQTNPVLLDVALALSMACAVIANICLVIRFLEKSVQRMTVLCVIFLTIHGVSTTVVRMCANLAGHRYNQYHSCERLRHLQSFHRWLYVRPSVLGDPLLNHCIVLYQHHPRRRPDTDAQFQQKR